MRNGAVVGGDARNVSPPFTRNAPPSSFSSNRDSPQRCGEYRSSRSSADDSDVCVTPGVSHGHGVLMEHQRLRRQVSDHPRRDGSKCLEALKAHCLDV